MMNKKLVTSMMTFSLIGTSVFATGLPTAQPNINNLLTGAIVQNNTTYIPLETLLKLINTPATLPSNVPTTLPSNVPIPNIAQEQAFIQLLAQYGLTLDDVTNLEINVDNDDNIPTYEIEFDSTGKEYEYEINANTGKVLESDVDYNDYDDYDDDDYDDYDDDDDDDDYDDYDDYDDDDDDDDDDGYDD